MRFYIVALALLPTACTVDLEDGASLPALDESFYRCRVQPIVTKSCSMFVCHGDANRYYKLFARNRLRLGLQEEQRNATTTEAERRFDFDATRAHVDAANPRQSLLLLKPLDQSAGGYFHGGATEYGMGDVFLSEDEPDYQTMLAWVNGETEDPSCIEPGSDL